MTFVVTEACIRCKYTDCVDVCPTDAFREGPNFLAIDPDAAEWALVDLNQPVRGPGLLPSARFVTTHGARRVAGATDRPEPSSPCTCP